MHFSDSILLQERDKYASLVLHREIPERKGLSPEASDTRKLLNSLARELSRGEASVPVDSGLHRKNVPAVLKPSVLKELGFYPSYIAVPEKGQSSWRTWRDPMTNLHLHRHPDRTYMHRDKYPPLQTVIKRLGELEGMDKLKEILAAFKHILMEGVPGYASYIKGQITGAPSMRDIEKDPGLYNAIRKLM